MTITATEGDGHHRRQVCVVVCARTIAETSSGDIFLVRPWNSTSISGLSDSPVTTLYCRLAMSFCTPWFDILRGGSVCYLVVFRVLVGGGGFGEREGCWGGWRFGLLSEVFAETYIQSVYKCPGEDIAGDVCLIRFRVNIQVREGTNVMHH